MCQLSLFQTLSQILFENAFDQVPSHSQECGHGLDGGDAAQLYNKPIEGFQRPALGPGKVNGLPKHPPTSPTVLLMPMKDDFLRLASDG